MTTLLNSVPQVLRHGMKEAGLTQQEVFTRYRAKGGRMKQPNTVGEWLRGRRDVPYVQLTILFGVVNEQLQALGKELIEIPFPKGLIETDSQPSFAGTAYMIRDAKEAPEGAPVIPSSSREGSEDQMSYSMDTHHRLRRAGVTGWMIPPDSASRELPPAPHRSLARSRNL